MLKKAIFRRIALTGTALFVFAIIYFFPSTDKTNNDFIQELVYNKETPKISIYLLDYNNYVAKSYIAFNSQNIESNITEIIETLTMNGKKGDYIPNGFKALIPEDTKLLNQSLDNKGLLKIDFSKEFLKIKSMDEEKMIEAIIYSLTEIKEVKKIMIFVEGKQLTELPHSKKYLPRVLDRNFGINKIYDLDKLKDSTKTTVYYVSKYNSNYYYVPVTFVNNNSDNKIEIIINELKSSQLYQTNLMSYLATNAELLTYEVKENKVYMSFNKYLLDDFKNKSILEEVKYTIALSIKDNLDATDVIFNVDNEEISTITLENVDKKQ